MLISQTMASDCGWKQEYLEETLAVLGGQAVLFYFLCNFSPVITNGVMASPSKGPVFVFLYVSLGLKQIGSVSFNFLRCTVYPAWTPPSEFIPYSFLPCQPPVILLAVLPGAGLTTLHQSVMAVHCLPST